VRAKQLHPAVHFGERNMVARLGIELWDHTFLASDDVEAFIRPHRRVFPRNTRKIVGSLPPLDIQLSIVEALYTEAAEAAE